MPRRFWRNLPVPLLAGALSLSCVGVALIFSASRSEGASFASKQLAWLAVGLLAFIVVVRIGYRRILNFAYPFYGVCLGLLLFVLAFGRETLGAQRWISIGGFALQPSEFTKLAFALTLAKYLGGRNPHTREVWRFVAAFLMAAVPMALIIRQPDLGSALVFLPMLYVCLFVWGVRLRYLFGTIALGLGAAPIFWMMLKGYQKRRLLVFVNPNADPLGAGYTAIQAKVAVGSGGLLGRGFLQGTQTHLDFVPEHHTDFIFSVLGEEWGFLGALVLLCGYAFLLFQMFRISEHTTDRPARLLSLAVLAVVFFQVFINVGMSVGVMPITGLPLPLVSYGGSSLLTFFVALGLLASIHRERSIF